MLRPGRRPRRGRCHLIRIVGQHQNCRFHFSDQTTVQQNRYHHVTLVPIRGHHVRNIQSGDIIRNAYKRHHENGLIRIVGTYLQRIFKYSFRVRRKACAQFDSVAIGHPNREVGDGQPGGVQHREYRTRSHHRQLINHQICTSFVPYLKHPVLTGTHRRGYHNRMRIGDSYLGRTVNQCAAICHRTNLLASNVEQGCLKIEVDQARQVSCIGSHVEEHLHNGSRTRSDLPCEDVKQSDLGCTRGQNSELQIRHVLSPGRLLGASRRHLIRIIAQDQYGGLDSIHRAIVQRDLHRHIGLAQTREHRIRDVQEGHRFSLAR